MANIDADPDLSKDTKLKQVFRGFTNALYEWGKPTPRTELPWYNLSRWIDLDLGQDPLKEPRKEYRLERQFNLLYNRPTIDLPTIDLFGYAVMRQHHRCGDLEMKCLECIEYYGAHRGSIICQDYYDDWKECSSTNLSRLRVRAMDLQYKKKYWEYFRGEREYPYQPIPHPQGFFEPLRSYKNDFSDGNVG